MGYASLAELTAKRRHAVDSAHELIGSGLREFLAGLYPDNAHFIYELLQNAEDARATVVDFDLKRGGLVFTHDGAKEFTLENIEAITTIGHTTKRTDDAAIGKFGVGFKAVFSYTNRPLVRSGQYAFAIEDLFVPEPIEISPTGNKTVFTFPFDRKEKPREVAYEEVSRGLRALRETTVLFLRNIRVINYQLADGATGRIVRTDLDYPFVRINHEADRESRESHWLRLVGGHTISKIIPEGHAVAAAFRLDNSPSKSKPIRGKSPAVSVEPLQRGDTCVYFPAEKETSGLRFHIHAPFASIPARDSIKDTTENSELVDAIGCLVASSLPQLRDDGWLTDGLLEALPNGDDVLAPPYAAIRDRIYEAFRAEPLTPVLGGGYAPSSALVSSPSEFRAALGTVDLKFLTTLLHIDYPESPRWVPERAGRAGRFIAGLGVKHFGWNALDSVFNAIDAADQSEEDIESVWCKWLLEKSPERLKAFYELLGRGADEGEFDASYFTEFTSPLIQVRHGDAVAIVPAAQAYLPSSPEDAADGRVPAELSYFDNDEQTRSKGRLAAFYQEAGVRRWDERAQVQERLVVYRSASRPTKQQHLYDMCLFVTHLTSNPKDSALFKDVPFLRARRPGEADTWTTSNRLLIDEPYRPTGLARLYAGNPGLLALSDVYRGKVAGIEEFARLLGATTSLSISTANVWSNKERKASWYPSGSRDTFQGVKQDWDLPELPTIIESMDSTLLGGLWQLMIEKPEHFRYATFQLNASATRYTLRSQLAQRLEGEAWLLDRRGKLRTPESMTTEDLPEGWPEPPPGSLAMALGFGKEARAQDEASAERDRRAHDAGVPVELLDVLEGVTAEERKALFEEFIAKVKARENFPTSASANPERRAAMVAADAENAPEFETQMRERSIVIGRSETRELSKQYLRAEYTNDTGDMSCQACHQQMPFKLNGQWYFEAVQFIPKRIQTHYQNALALCPLCSALYTCTRETADSILLTSMREIEVPAEACRIALPVILNGKRVELWFTGKHAFDLKTVLDVAGA